jgi:hypothetical protein
MGCEVDSPFDFAQGRLGRLSLCVPYLAIGWGQR